MTRTTPRRSLPSGLAALVVAGSVLLPTAAQAHSLDSSTIAVRIDQGDGAGTMDVEATVSVAVETLSDALGTASADVGSEAWATEAVAYLDEHTTVTAADGTVWDETWSDAVLEQVEGISSLSVDVTLDSDDQATSAFTIAYDAVIEAVPAHEAVVVLTDADGAISTPGVVDATSSSLTITTGQASTTTASLADMVGYGFHHVLAGADHLLFLLALLLPAPLVVVAGRWQRRTGLLPTLRKTAAVVTCFTLGHLVTLVAATLGWLQLPTQPVEVLIAVSVAVAAVHAVRPLVRHGEELIAGGFGLVHGLAFATILSGLGLRGATSVLDLLAFNVGVEAAQLSAVALTLPSLYVLSRTRWYPALRLGGALLALSASTGWALDRLEVLTNPTTALETQVVARPLWVVGVLAAGAVAGRMLDRTSRADCGSPCRRPKAGVPVA